MIKHIVLWKLHDRKKAGLIRQTLEALPTRIPGIHKLEVGTGMPAGEFTADVVLYSELESRAALEAYQAHPEHQAVVPLIKGAAIARTVVDFEV